MTIEIIFTQADEETVIENHNEMVAEKLKSKIETKNETLQWKSTFSECRKRFYSIIGSNDAYFPEVNFKPGGKNYRAVFAWLPSRQEIRFVRAVAKENRYTKSKQWEIIKQIETHPEKVLQEIQTKCNADENAKEVC